MSGGFNPTYRLQNILIEKNALVLESLQTNHFTGTFGYFTNLVVQNFSGPTGLTVGATGPKGDSITGPQGNSITGPQGNSIIGPTGAQGNSITGPTGAQGISITGPTGPQGTSITGPIGPQGDSITGPTGAQGNSITGPTGPKGDSIIGPTGAQGNSITGPTGALNAQQVAMILNSTNSIGVYSQVINSVATITIRSASGSYYIGQGFWWTGPSQNVGYLVTCSHVIGDPDIASQPVCSNIWIHTTYPTNTIQFVDGVNLRVMGYDKISDVALIQVVGSNYPRLSVVNSRTGVSIGETVSIVGYPSAFDVQSVTRGVVRDNKSQAASDLMESVMTDASIYGGNSGGPMLNNSGAWMGILSWGITGEENLNGGVASYLAQPILQYYLDNFTGSVVSYPKGYLGISTIEINATNAVILGLTSVQGFYVNALDGFVSPAKFAIGDIIWSIESTPVGILNDQSPLFTEIQLRPPGTTINIGYRPSGSYGSLLTKSVTLSSFNPARDFQFSTYRRTPVPNPFL